MRLEAPDHKHFVGIVIVTCSEWQRYANIKEIMYGIEEEQVPFEIWKEFHKAEDILCIQPTKRQFGPLLTSECVVQQTV